jgi:SAM-dependent methyltransferase
VSLDRLRAEWETLADVDPLWAILSDPERRGGKWTPEEFFAEGEEEVELMLAGAREVGGPPAWGRALDFGCGAGRLTRALGERFEACVGVDIAEGMVDLARRLNADRRNLEFLVNTRSDLSLLEPAGFDLVYSSLVLQHQPSREVALGYVREFLRVARPGGLVVFQLPTWLSPLGKFQLKRRTYGLLTRAGIKPDVVLGRANVSPMHMIAVPERKVRALVESAGASVLRVEAEVAAAARYYVRAAAA